MRSSPQTNRDWEKKEIWKKNPSHLNGNFIKMKCNGDGSSHFKFISLDTLSSKLYYINTNCIKVATIKNNGCPGRARGCESFR